MVKAFITMVDVARMLITCVENMSAKLMRLFDVSSGFEDVG